MLDLHEAVNHHYQILAEAWSDETANPKSRPLPEGMPSSYGQCEVASDILLGVLRDDFPDEHLCLTEGRVLAVVQNAGSVALLEIIPEHTWIDHTPSFGPMSAAEVFDVTADQARYRSLPKVITAKYDTLNSQGILYQPRRFFEDPYQFGECLKGYNSAYKERLLLLRERYEKLRRSLY